MSDTLALEALVRTNPPLFEGRYGSTPVAVHLDTSATIKLEGDVCYDELREALASKRERVADAARRLIVMRQTKSIAGKLVVTISALDLD